jgi:hypothetical protein
LKDGISPLGLDVLSRAYKFLLRLYTKRSREEFGSQMMGDFRTFCRNAWKRDGLLGVISIWIELSKELLQNALLERISQFKRYLVEVKQYLMEAGMRGLVGIVAQISSVMAMGVIGIVALLLWTQLLATGAFHSGFEQGAWFLVLFDGAIAVVGLACLVFWESIARILFGAR